MQLAMGLRLGGSKGTGAPAPSFPPVAGQTLVTNGREWFDADRTSGSLGIFATISGQISSVNDGRGPRAADHLTRHSGAMRQYTAAEKVAGTMMFEGQITTQVRRTGSATLRQMVSAWFFFAGNNPMDAQQVLFYLQEQTDPYPMIELRYQQDSTGLNFYDRRDNSLPGSPGSDLTGQPADSWYRVGYVIEAVGTDPATALVMKTFVENLAGTVHVLGTNAFSYKYGAPILFVRQTLLGNHGGPAGRIAALSIYNLDAVATGLLTNTDVGPPVAVRKTFSMPSDFATPADLVAAKRNCVFLGVPVPLKDSSGNNKSFSVLNTTLGAVGTPGTYANLSKAMGDAYRLDSDYLVPQGDTLSISAGTYYFTASAEGDFSQIRGIDIKAADPLNKPVFYLDRLFTSDWELNGVNVWETSDAIDDGAARVGVWQSDGAGGWLPLYPIRIADSTIGRAACAATEGSYWTEQTGSGTAFVHPYGNIDPNTVDWRFAAEHLTAGDTNEGFFTADGRVMNLIYRGGFHYDNDTSTVYSHYHALSAGAIYGYVAIIDGIEGKEYGKHTIGCGAQSTVRAVIITKDCIATSGPVPNLPAKTITGIVNGGTTLTVTTSTNHNYWIGAVVAIADVVKVGGGGHDIIGNRTITAVTANTFTVTQTTAHEYLSGGTCNIAAVGYGAGAWTAFVLHSGNTAASIAFDGVIALIYDCVDRPNLSVVGSTTPTYHAGYQSFLVHNSGGSNQFAYVGLFGNDFTASQDSYLSGNGTVQDYDVGA